MIRLLNTRLLASLSLVLFVGVFASCNKKDSLPNDGKAALNSFGPTGAKFGDTLRFIGVNLDQVSTVKFTGVNAVIDKASFKSQASDLIRLIVPQSAEKGYVTLKLSNGDSIVTKTQLNLGVVSSASSISPKTARPGDNVTITGTNLNWIERVTFGKNQLVTNFVSRSQTQLVVKIPDAAQTGPLVLHNASTDSTDIETTDTLKVTLPVGTSLSPNPIKHGDNLTISGTDLDLVRKVTFTGGAVVTSFVSQSATQLVVKVPGSATKGKVKIEPGSGIQQTVGGPDLDLILPLITGMSPNPVDTLINVTLNGTNLDLASSVSFKTTTGGTKTIISFVSQSPTQIVLQVPSGVVSAKITLGVKNSTVTVQSPTLLGIIGAPPPPIVIYDDALNWNGWVGGGWGGTKDLANTTIVNSGTKSIKIDYAGGYGVPLQLGGANIPIDGYTILKVSIYGGSGSNGKSVNIGFNEQDGKTVTLVEGQWNNFSIPLSQISATTMVGFLYIKEYTGTGNFTIYVDDLGIF